MWTQRLNRLVTRLELEQSQVEIIGWSHLHNLPTNVPHRHSYFEACLVGEQGEGRFEFDGHSHALQPGTFFVARPGQIHQIINTSAPDMELFWVCFALGTGGKGEVGGLVQEFASSSHCVAMGQNHLLAQWNALRAVAQNKTSSSGDELALTYLAQALLLGIFQAGAQTQRSVELGAQASEEDIPSADNATERDVHSHHVQLARLGVRYITDNLDRPLGVEELCHHLGVSRRQISRLFSAYTGLTPAAYIERARLDRAQALLRHGEKSIKEVASAVGYNDVHHFTRVFSRVIGTPPGEYRARGGPRTPRLFGPNIQIPGSLV